MKTFSEERVRELYMEGFRLQDLKRWGLGFERTAQSYTQEEGQRPEGRGRRSALRMAHSAHELEAPGSEITPKESNNRKHTANKP